MGLLSAKLPERGPYGLLAEFDGPGALLRACEQVRDRGYTRWDAHAPFPVHGLERAMGLKPTVLPWFVLTFAMAGALGGFGLQWWVHAEVYPLVISGKPFFSWPAYMPITFELGVLGGASAAVLALLGLSQLPTLNHPLFNSKRFDRAGDDAFFISIEAEDPAFDAAATERLLREAGAVDVERVDV